MTLSTKLRELRSKCGWTQQNLADLLKVARSTISKYETGKIIPDYQTLLQLADLYNVEKEYLISELDGLVSKPDQDGYMLKENSGDRDLHILIPMIQKEQALKSILLELYVLSPKHRAQLLEKFLVEIKYLKKLLNK